MSFELLFGCAAMIHTLASALSLNIEDVQVPSFCDSLGCANNATCRTTLTNNEIEGSHVTYSECLCYDHWIGPTCEHHLELSMLGHHGNTAHLKTDVISKSVQSRGFTRDTKSQMESSDLRFNVQYWSNQTGAMCNIMTGVRSKEFKIQGLKSGKFYSVCVSAVGVDLCFVKSDAEVAKMRNCVAFKSLERNETLQAKTAKQGYSEVVAPLSLTIFFVIVLLLIIVILVKCRKSRHLERIRPAFRQWRSSLRGCTCPCLTSVSTTTTQPRTDGWLLPRTSIGRFKRGKRGHAHCTGIPLTTIIEYRTEETETPESPLMDPQQPKPIEELA